MSLIDILIILAYPLVILVASLWKEKSGFGNADLVLAGRTLTLPALVASLVSTWYGGILGIGEYTWRYGLANWLVFALPYYVGAGLFALFLAKRARTSEALTIPQRLNEVYGPTAGRIGALLVFLIAAPGAYLLILGVLGQTLFGWPQWVGLTASALFSLVILLFGGFRSVVRADVIQTVAMFLGFGVLSVYLFSHYGGVSYLSAHLPAQHLTWNGGQSFWAIIVWYFIALGTLTDPAFFQRCYAAKTPQVAQRGIILSIVCWGVFDALSTTCGLYARALLPNLSDPVASFPTLATTILPVGLVGLFSMAMIATAQSTVDSYLFLCGTTFGHDLIGKFGQKSETLIRTATRYGLLIATILAIACALLFQSVVDIWYLIGSIGTPALLVPVVTSFIGEKRMPPIGAIVSIIASAIVASVWYSSQWTTGDGSFWYGIPPIIPGLCVSLLLYFSSRRKEAMPPT